MRHPDDLIRRYLDGELPQVAMPMLREHLAACARCRAHLRALEQLDARLRGLDRFAPPLGFAAQVRDGVAALPPPRRPPRWQAPLALAMALIGMLGVLAARDDLFALVDDLFAAAEGALSWLIALAGGEIDLATGGVAWFELSAQPALIVGLCMLGLAGALVLRRSLVEMTEV